MSANKLSPRALNLIEVRDRFIQRHGPDDPYLKHLQREIDEAMQPQEDEPQHFVVGFRSSPPSPSSPPAPVASQPDNPPAVIPQPQGLPAAVKSEAHRQYRDGLEAQARSK